MCFAAQTTRQVPLVHITLILPRSRTETVWFYTSSSNKRAVRPKLYTKSLTRDLKLMYSRFTLVRISINLNSSQLNMFREIILPIFKSTRLCVTACGVMHTPRWPIGHVGGRLLLRYYGLYQRLQLQFYLLLMMGAMDTRNI